MMKLSIFLTAVALIILFTFGFQYSGADGERDIQLATIYEVRVSITESYPPQVFVYIKGGLADRCTTFHGLTTERSRDNINFIVTTERPKEANCAQVCSYFDKNVNLGTDFASSKTYILNVDDEKTSFVMY